MLPLQDDKRPVVIVGGGVAGCTLAYELSKRRRVVLLEQHRIGTSGASSVPAALLNPYRGRSARASEEDRAGLRAMWALVGELEKLGLEHGVHQTGVLRIASNQKQSKTWRGRDGVRWLEAEEVPAGYHAPFGGFLVESGGWLEPHKFLHALILAAKQRGAVVREDCEVTGLEAEEDYKVHTTQGTFLARTVILCVGSSLNPDLPLPGLERVAGDVVGFETDVDLPYPLAGAVYGAKCEKRVYVGGNHRPAGEEDLAAPQQLQRAGSWFVPALKEAAHVSTWTGVRAKTEDNAPLVQERSPKLWFFGALAGRGFLCSALLSRRLAEAL